MSLMQSPAASTEAVPQRPSDSLWLYALFALLATAGFFYVNIMAAIVDGLVTGLGFSNTEAGIVGSANIYGASVGSLIAVFIVRHLPWRRTLFILLCALLCIDLASIAIDQVTLLTAVRAVHGLIGGMAVGVTYSAMARTRSPDRAFGMLLMVQFGLGGLGVMFLPQLVPEYGARILFLVLAGVTTAALLATFAIPPIDARERTQNNATHPPLESSRRWTAGFTLLAMFLFQAGNMALAAFIIGLGGHFGLQRDFISLALGWATWIGAVGAILVIVLGTRMGRMRPLLVALLLTLIGNAAFWWSANQTWFFLANIGTAVTWSFVVPYLFGMLSRLDPSGRLATLGGFLSKLGLASGPLAAGLLLHSGSYRLLIGVSTAALALSAIAALIAARRSDQLEETT